MINRRDFLKHGAAGATFISLAGGVGGLLPRAAAAAAAADQNDHLLVVIELSGGNDGLNTLAPFEDPLYYKNRPTLALPKENVLRLSDQVGLHPQMTGLGELFKAGRLAVVQGVGYPEPDRSHFRSMEIWHTASTEKVAPIAGWLGKCLDVTSPPDSEQLAGLALTSGLPQAFQAEHVVIPVVSQLEGLGAGDDAAPKAKLLRKLSTAPGAAGPVGFIRQQAEVAYRAAERLKDAAGKYQSKVEYPDSGLGAQLRQAAQIAAADLGARVLYASQDGYDTHSSQGDSHAGLLGDLSASLTAFQQDLEGLGLAKRVVALVFSEFGRRVDENASQGTDHGAASCLFVAGAPVTGGLYGKYPSLADLGDGDLKHTIDFRSVYAALLESWLGCPAGNVFSGDFGKLELIQSTG